MNKKKKTQKSLTTIKILLVILWGLFLLLNTWTESIERLIYLHSFGFRWVSNPDFLSFFYFHDFTLIHPEFIKVKFGHFIGFAIMDILLFNLLRSHKYSIIISIIFAFLTEFLQLFFGRDGRFYDLAIDSFGIISVYFLVNWLKF
ncbi:VanZ family protein [Neobacillus sp. OS1-33]|uniref:VanZ family protein n=1 Tax=Neobacillus sp. OS1-33 TaxID=3070683 RepID=UPI0027DEEC83|nr:VanZ family protein [Neobacillus sp. OS1-33]WML25175.1 VanZ family protein [Neobacillus sp. OS1-33]